MREATHSEPSGEAAGERKGRLLEYRVVCLNAVLTSGRGETMNDQKLRLRKVPESLYFLYLVVIFQKNQVEK